MRSLWLLPATSLALAGCSGMIGDPGVSPAESSRPRAPTPANSLCELDLPPDLLRRLTREQYDRTVRDLLGVDASPASGFAPDDATEGFEIGLTTSPLLAEQYFTAAEALAAEAVADLGALLPCDPGAAGEDACARAFVEDFVMRAYRRPLDDAEIDRFVALYADAKARYDFTTGIQLVVQAALASPAFLYHQEGVDGAPGEAVPVTGYAMASRLSYFLWGSMPDEPLFAAAAAGELDTPDDVAAHARRLLDDPRAEVGLRNFYRQWLRLDTLDGMEKDPATYPDWSPAMATSMRASIHAFVDHVVWERRGTVEDLLVSDVAFVDAALAPAFGVDVSGGELTAVTVDPAERSGLLTQPGLLALLSKANQSDPVIRGKFVREQIFCQQLPPPPADLVIRAPDPEPGVTTRERFSQHRTDPACSGCHQLMDPIGFGLESYDGIGAFRTEEEGSPIDASGELVLTDDADGPFVGAIELSERLAGSNEVRECVARHLFRYSVGRVETTRESCAMNELFDRAAEAGWSLTEMLVAVTQSHAFLYHRIPEDAR